MNEDAVRLWIRRAGNDLKIGVDELTTDNPATDAICFHMQQCCEKFLKAYLIFHGEEYPRTHDIALLVTGCARIDPEFDTQIESGVHTLTKYAVGVRYDEEIFPSLEETKQAIELAEKLKRFVLTRLRQKGFEP